MTAELLKQLLEPNFAETLVGGVVYASAVAKGTCAHVNTKARPLGKEVQVVCVASGSGTEPRGSFGLSFRGHATRALGWDSIAGQVKRALEELLPVGTVNVTRHAALSPAAGFEFVVSFEPTAQCNRRHALSYGNLPPLLPVAVALELTDGAAAAGEPKGHAHRGRVRGWGGIAGRPGEFQRPVAIQRDCVGGEPAL
jgi:hypothetical protein